MSNENQNKSEPKFVLSWQSVVAIIIFTLLFSWIINSYFLYQTNENINNRKLENISSEQEYVNVLKELNEQSQKRFDRQVSFYSWVTGSIALATGFFTLGLIYVSFIGWKEYENVRKQREEVDDVLARHKKLVEKGEEFKVLVRDNVKNLVFYAIVDVFYRLERFDLADLTVIEINSAEENQAFQNDVEMLKGKIKYKRGDYKDSLSHYEKLKDVMDDSVIYDLIGATYKNLYNEGKKTEEKYFNAAIENFEIAFSKAKNAYDRKRILSNKQSTYNQFEKYDKTIEVYNELKKIKISNKLKAVRDYIRLEVGINLVTINAYKKGFGKIISSKPIDDLLGMFETHEEMNTYVRNNFGEEWKEILDTIQEFRNENNGGIII